MLDERDRGSARRSSAICFCMTATGSRRGVAQRADGLCRMSERTVATSGPQPLWAELSGPSRQFTSPISRRARPTPKAIRCAWLLYKSWQGADASGGADAQGQRAGRRDPHLPPGSAALHRQADRAGAELRRPGRHRHREHAAAQRTAPAHRRSHRIAGAADRDQRDAAASSRALPATCSRCSRPSLRTRSAHLRSQIVHRTLVRRR